MSDLQPNLAEESASLYGYFSDAPLDIDPVYPPPMETFETDHHHEANLALAIVVE